jgi:alpha-beta hydrolase superfamily lysophospholipase
MIEDWFPLRDGIKLFCRRWAPERRRAALLIVHGMADHGGRYDELARRLCDAGIEVWAADLRGFGRTAGLAENDPGRGGLLGHCADAGAADLLLGDIGELVRRIREGASGKKVFLLGHSWGSFLTRCFIAERGGEVDGCILSGTRGPGGLELPAGRALLALIAFLRGPRRFSALSRAVSDGPFNRPFRPNRTPFDWISRDEAEVDKYLEDPLGGTPCSSGFYRDLVGLLERIQQKKALEGIRKGLPVYIYAGTADPVGDMGAGPTALVAAYRRLGLEDMEFVLYPGARHELHHETNREEMTANLIDWLNRHSGEAS